MHRSARLAFERPRGIRATCASLMSVESDIDQRSWEETAAAIGGQASFGLLFRLVLFHSILQERHRFGTVGFNAAYQFGLDDFRATQSALHQYIANAVVLNEADSTNGGGPDVGSILESVQELIGSVVYGGHVTDLRDQRCI